MERLAKYQVIFSLLAVVVFVAFTASFVAPCAAVLETLSATALDVLLVAPVAASLASLFAVASQALSMVSLGALSVAALGAAWGFFSAISLHKPCWRQYWQLHHRHYFQQKFSLISKIPNCQKKFFSGLPYNAWQSGQDFISRITEFKKCDFFHGPSLIAIGGFLLRVRVQDMDTV